MDWQFDVLSGNYCPRQFEYHPTADGLIFGTMYGEVVSVNARDSSCTQSLGYFGVHKNDTILGLCWLKNNTDRFISGSSQGRVCCGEAAVAEFNSPPSSDYVHRSYGTPPVPVAVQNTSLLRDYERFERLTSVHVNSTNDLLLLSGYARSVRVYDLETGQVTHRFRNIHRDHINISRFANLSPHLFATSSFDGTIKTWDLRQKHYVVDSNSSASASAVDNEALVEEDGDTESVSSAGSIATTPSTSPVGRDTIRAGVLQSLPLASTAGGGGSGGNGGSYNSRSALFSPSSGGPIYTVQCNSGVVMINFSCDDVFLLASALDNEINQYLFLSGEKHLSYRIPRTGLAGNFTRAYYSASGRHAITGACEESTVKLLCTYTGETLSQVDVYPGKKDKSLYIQSLRGSPVDDDKLCVLVNYRDMLQRELIMATYTGKKPISAAAATRSLMSPGSAGVVHSTLHSAAAVDTCNAIAVDTVVATPATASTASTLVMSSPAIDLDSSIHVDDSQQEDYRKLAHNLFLAFHSPTYLSHMRSLHRACRRLLRDYSTVEVKSIAASADNGSVQYLPLHVVGDIVNPALDGNILEDSDGPCSDGSDIVLLVHSPLSNSRDITAAGGGHQQINSNDRWTILPVHTFLIAARCPLLFRMALLAIQRLLTVTATASTTVTTATADSFSINSSDTALETASMEDSSSTDRCKPPHCLRMQSTRCSSYERDVPALSLDRILPSEVVYLLPVIVEYLYLGNNSIDIVVTRYYCLLRMVNADTTTATSGLTASSRVKSILLPLLGDYLRSDIQLLEGAALEDALLRVPASLKQLLRCSSSHRSADDRVEVGYPWNPLEDVSFLLLVAMDEHCWRHCYSLASALVLTLEHMYQVGNALQLTGFHDLIDSLAQQSLNVNTATGIYSLAESCSRNDLKRCCAIFIANHQQQIAINNVNPNINSDTSWGPIRAAIESLSTSLEVDVLTREELRSRIEHFEAQLAVKFDSEKSTVAATVTVDDSDAGKAEIEQQQQSIASVALEADVDTSVEKHRWMLDEMPFFMGSKSSSDQKINPSAGSSIQQHTVDSSVNFDPAICLPRFLIHTASLMLDDDVVIIGGIHLEKTHNMNSRLLVYNVSSDTFTYKSCGGTHLPKNCTMGRSCVLQKDCATHLIVLGGKLKKNEIPHSNSALLEHLRISDNSNSASAAVAGSNSTASSSAIAGKVSSETVVNNNASGNATHCIATSSFFWNESADIEELSLQTAQARRQTFESQNLALSNSGSRDDATVRDKRRAKLSNMGLIYELNYVTMTWSSPSVLIGSPATTATSTCGSMFNAPTAAQQERIHTSLIAALKRRVGQSLTAIYPQDLRYRCTNCIFRANSFARESALCQCTATNSMVDNYHQQQERFLEQYHLSQGNHTPPVTKKTPSAYDLLVADHSIGTTSTINISAAAEVAKPSIEGDDGFLKDNTSWMVQFGGYCGRDSSISNDLHVLICQPKLPPSFRSFDNGIEIDTAASTAKGSLDQSSVESSYLATATATKAGAANVDTDADAATAKKAQLEYEYRWVRTTASGVPPSARFSHSCTLIPAKPAKAAAALASSRFAPLSAATAAPKLVDLFSHTRILYYGGIGYGHDYDLLASLRINQSIIPRNYQFENGEGVSEALQRYAAATETESYLHWETVNMRGPSPGRRHGHSMVYLEDRDMCVLYGGLRNERNDMMLPCDSDVWVLQLEDVSRVLVPASGAEAAAAHFDAHLLNASQRRCQIESKLNVCWSRVRMLGIPPSPRTKHTCTATATAALVRKRSVIVRENSVIPTGGSAGDIGEIHGLTLSQDPSDSVLLIFGGLDEIRHQNEVEEGNMNNVDFDKKQKDSVMHIARLSPWSAGRSCSGLWETFYKPPSRFLYVPTEPFVAPACCTLSRDMLQLLGPLLKQNLQMHEAANSSIKAVTNDDDAASTVVATDVAESDTETDRMRALVAEFDRFMHLDSSSPAVTTTATKTAITADVSCCTDTAADMTFKLIHDSALATIDFPVHSALVSQRSRWVRTLLNSSMKEAQTKLIQLHGIDPVAFHLILIYLYADAVMFTAVGDVVAVLELANQYDLHILSKKCEGILIRLVTRGNVCELLEYSDSLNLRVLKVACVAELLRSPVVKSLLLHHSSAASMDLEEQHSNPYELEHISDGDELLLMYQQLSPELRNEVHRICMGDMHSYIGNVI